MSIGEFSHKVRDKISMPLNGKVRGSKSKRASRQQIKKGRTCGRMTNQNWSCAMHSPLVTQRAGEKAGEESRVTLGTSRAQAEGEGYIRICNFMPCSDC